MNSGMVKNTSSFFPLEHCRGKRWYWFQGFKHYLHNGSDELLEESRDLQQGGPEVVQEVDEEPFDVRTIVVLIGHDHQVAVAEGGTVVINFAEGKTQYLGDVLNFLILHDLLMRGFSDIQQLPLQRKHAVVVTSNYSEAADR